MKISSSRYTWLIAAVILIGAFGLISGAMFARQGGSALLSKLTGASQTTAESTPAVDGMISVLETASAQSPSSVRVIDVPGASGGGGSSLRFYGNGAGGIDRVMFPVDPQRPLDIGAEDFTLEFWLRTTFYENGQHSCENLPDDWMNANTIFDRDILDAGGKGDFGIGLASGRIAFGVNVGEAGATLCGQTFVDDSKWHHIAVTRQVATGRMRLFIDGAIDGEAAGPAGDISYRDGLTGANANDPFLVLGSEKFDDDPESNSFSGWIDEICISRGLLYEKAFTRPARPFSAGAETLALYHLDEGSGASIQDASAAPGAPGRGYCRYGGSPGGPEWWSETPFDPPLLPSALGACDWAERVYIPILSR